MEKTTILIVEDEAIVAADLAGKLGLLGYDVVGTVATGEDAIEMACGLKPQVVLMDIRLKREMDGIEATEAINRRHCAPVIYLTSHSDAVTLARAKLSGPFGYILKPFEERELSTTIEMALYKHQSEQKLREQREWLQVTLVSIGDAVITCDTKGLVTFLNPVAEELSGWVNDEAGGRPIREVFSLINEDSRLPPDDIVTLVLKEGKTKTLANHTALVTRDGREIPIEDSAAPILDFNGRVIGAVIVFHDVTEKRRDQEALKRSHEELEMLVGERTKELKELNEDLENRIIERTAQLKSANETLRASRIAALNLMEDAVIARKEAEELSAELLLEIEERKRAEEERQTSVEFLQLVNESKNSADLIRTATFFFREKSGCEAVGLRLRDGDDYPYFEAHGFPEVFVLLENHLCEYNENGELIRDSAGDPVVECMCGNVIRGRLDPSKPFFTSNGSFWSNCTTELLAGTTEADRQARTRNRCNGEGYESVALIPLCMGEERLGLLQLNDRQQGRFSPAAIALWERLSGYLSVALTKFSAEEALRENYQRSNLLAETTAQLLASDSPQSVVDNLCRRVMEVLDCQAFFNFLVDEKAGRLHLNACAGIPEDEVKKLEWLDYGAAVCGCAARDACRIVAEDIPNTPDPRTELVKSYGITAYACHPLMVQGRVLGTLSFGTCNRPGFAMDELSLMKAVADQVAIAMERKQADRSLRLAKDAAEAATRAKSQFLANMSHELRTPMTGVLGMLEIVKSGSLDEKQREAIDMAHASGRSLIRIINDILDLTKVESGKLVIEVKPFDLADCVAGAVDILIPEARRKGLDLVRSVADGLPRTVAGDKVRLQQVLTNLAGNAVKFTEKGKVEVKVTSGGNTSTGKKDITFTVADTGIGISNDKKELIFDSFNQADVSHTRQYGGTGLGLSISRELVEKMGGTLSFESTEGKGSSFIFTIPFFETEPEIETEPVSVTAEPKESVVTPYEDRNVRILIAEDDEVTRKILGFMLQQFKFNLYFATNGRMAVEMWEDGDYDLIIMDGQMPVMDGFAATGAIRERERERGGHIPIVAMTAHALREDKERCLAAGMDAYVSKPIDFKKCIEVIQELLGRDR